MKNLTIRMVSLVFIFTAVGAHAGRGRRVYAPPAQPPCYNCPKQTAPAQPIQPAPPDPKAAWGKNGPNSPGYKAGNFGTHSGNTVYCSVVCEITYEGGSRGNGGETKRIYQSAKYHTDQDPCHFCFEDATEECEAYEQVFDRVRYNRAEAHIRIGDGSRTCSYPR